MSGISLKLVTVVKTRLALLKFYELLERRADFEAPILGSNRLSTTDTQVRRVNSTGRLRKVNSRVIAPIIK